MRDGGTRSRGSSFAQPIDGINILARLVVAFGIETQDALLQMAVLKLQENPNKLTIPDTHAVAYYFWYSDANR